VAAGSGLGGHGDDHSSTAGLAEPERGNVPRDRRGSVKGPIAGVLIEMVGEVKDDPYRDVPESDRTAFDYIWD
jgi:hypothetical protein